MSEGVIRGGCCAFKLACVLMYTFREEFQDGNWAIEKISWGVCKVGAGHGHGLLRVGVESSGVDALVAWTPRYWPSFARVAVVVVGVRVRPVGLEAVLVAGGVARVGAVAGVVVGTGLVDGANTGETPVPPTRLKWQVLGASEWHGCGKGVARL